MLNVVLALALALQPAGAVQDAVAHADLPPPPEQVLAIPDELQARFQAQVLDRTHSQEQRMYLLPKFLFDQDGLGLTYDSHASHTIAESYQTSKVNCLAFTLLALTLAREAGLNAYPQQITRVMAWSLDGDIVVQTMHTNIVVEIADRKFTLDILADKPSALVLNYRISDDHLRALFYGNRAAEQLIRGHLPEAWSWQQAALAEEQQDATLWNTAGLIQMRLGNNKAAEAYFLRSNQLNPKLTSTLTNLISLYRKTGNLDQMHVWQQRAAGVLRHDPYYQYVRGLRAEKEGDLASAVTLFRQALKLYNGEHLFHFALARAYSGLGDAARAQQELLAAERLSDDAQARIYRAKLDSLRRLALGSAD